MATLTRSISAAPAWALSTVYAIGDHVENDTSKIYICTTGGTSAASGGPTTTGTGITDGTIVWDYVLTRDYSTLQSWEDASPADLVTAGNIWKGECYNHAEFTGRLTIGGITADATNYPWLTCAAGESFTDSASPVLDYDQTQGVGVKNIVFISNTTLYTFQQYSVVDKLQFYSSNTSNYGRTRFNQQGKLQDCIFVFDGKLKPTNANGISASDTAELINILAIDVCNNTSDAGTILNLGSGTHYNCGAVVPTGYSAGSVKGIQNKNYRTTIVNNCYVFGLSASKSFVQSGNGWGTSDYNATDDTTAPPGANSLNSLVYANQFVDAASVVVDYSLVSTSDLVGAGNTNATNAPNDIIGTARGAGTAGDIGPFEYVATDTTSPVLSLPTGTKTGSTTASGTVSTDEGNGTLYFIATVNTTETAATIKAGNSQSVSATGSQSVSFTGLTASTTYYAHYVHDDAATNTSNVVNSASFTTDAATSGQLMGSIAGIGGLAGMGGIAGNGGGSAG